MKTIQGGNENAHWNSELIKDLAFIKEHLRYRITKKLLSRSAIVGVIIALVGRLAWITWILGKSNEQTNIYLTVVLVLVIVVSITITTTGYLLVLRFKNVATPFFSTENQKLIQQFLESQHLVIYRHPDAPEVFQIISKNINTSKNEQREIMIFIADDKRILINSHFSNMRFTLLKPSRHYKQMAHRLKEYIKNHITSNNTTIVPLTI